jgi:hypothetical protein
VAPPLAEISFGELLLLVFEVFVFAVWFWIVFTIIGDLLRDRELSGWWKAVWVLLLVFVPFLTGLVYLIARGNGMAERTMKANEEKRASDRGPGSPSTGSPVDELDKLQGLRERGALTNAEFEQAKARLFA